MPRVSRDACSDVLTAHSRVASEPELYLGRDASVVSESLGCAAAMEKRGMLYTAYSGLGYDSVLKKLCVRYSSYVLEGLGWKSRYLKH